MGAGCAACQCGTVQFHQIKDGTRRKMNQLDCNVLNACDRGDGMSCPRETFHTVKDNYHTVNPINVHVHEHVTRVKRRQCTKISLHEIIILFPCTCSTNAIRLGNSHCTNIYLSPFIMFMCTRCFKKTAKTELLNTKCTCMQLHAVWGIDGRG